LVLQLFYFLAAQPGSPRPSQIQVMVEDRDGNPVAGLLATDFDVTNGKMKCATLSVSQEDQPITVGILVDTSASMRHTIGDGRPLRDAVKSFMESGHPNNTYFLAQFATDVKLLLDFSQDHQKVMEALPRSCGYGSLLFQALEACHKKLNEREGRKALLVISDGSDISGRPLGPVLEALEIPIMGLCPMVPGDDFEPQSSQLAQICEATGGKFRQEIRLGKEAGKMAALLRASYSLRLDCGTIPQLGLKLSIKRNTAKARTRILYSRRLPPTMP